MQERDDEKMRQADDAEESRSVYEMTREYDEAEQDAAGEDHYDEIWQDELNRDSVIPQVDQEETASLWSSLRDRIGSMKGEQTRTVEEEAARDYAGEDESEPEEPAETVRPSENSRQDMPEDEDDWDSGMEPAAGVEYRFDAGMDRTSSPDRREEPGQPEQPEQEEPVIPVSREERQLAWIRRGSAQERDPQPEEELLPDEDDDELPVVFGEDEEEEPSGRRSSGRGILGGLSGRLSQTFSSAFGKGLREEEASIPDEEEEEEYMEEPRESTGHLGIDGEEIPMPDIGARLLDILLVIWGFVSEFFRTGAVLAFRHVKNELKVENLPHLFSRYLLGIVIFYYEMVLKISTTRSPLGFSVFYILLYSIGWGLFGYLLTSFLRPRGNRTIRKILIPVLALPYIITYFTYRQFKYFYSPAEVWYALTTGAGGGITAIVRPVFTSNGLVHVIFFLIPFLLYIAFVQYWDKARRAKAGRRLHTLAVILCLFVCTWLLILLNGGYRRNYNKEYTFNKAVPCFGLLTADRLEVRNAIFGGRLKFEEEPAAEVTENTSSDLSEEITRSSLDINFGALAESASGTEKEMDLYLTTHTASSENEYTGLFKGKNLILITAESFSGELIDKNLTPTLYRLANNGIQFADYYVPFYKGSAGGEFEALFGIYPLDGLKSLAETADHHNVMTIGSMLTRMGYWGKAYTNLNYTQDGRDLSHTNLGYSEGFAGYGSGLESTLTDQTPRSDLELFQATVPEYIGEAPFNIYYMTGSGAGNYTKSGNAMSLKNWGAVEQIQGLTDTLLSYYSANLELEAALSYLVEELERTNQARNTVIVLTSNTYPYALDGNASLGNMPRLSELYGYSVETALQRDHNTLIMWSGSMEGKDSVLVKDPVSVIDILPTLANLFDAEWDSRLFPGRDVFSDAEALVFDMDYNWKTSRGTYISADGEFTPTDTMEVVSKDYQKRIRTIVRNKVRMMRGLLENDYMAHVFAGYTFAEDLVTGGRKRDITSGTTAQDIGGTAPADTEQTAEGENAEAAEGEDAAAAEGAAEGENAEAAEGEAAGENTEAGDNTGGTTGTTAARDWSGYLNATGE